MAAFRTSSVEQALEQLAAGGVVIVLDSEERENEGDFLAAAELAGPETIHFMITYGRGHLCQPITPGAAARLDIGPLVAGNGPESPCFAMPLDHSDCMTGISPEDRALTVRAIADPDSRPGDFSRPGHIFPLIARDGGVLMRPGHTESSVDLVQMAGLRPSGLLCEICSCDGRGMAGRDELRHLSREHHTPIVAVDALIEYRRAHDADYRSTELADQVMEDGARLTATTAGNGSSPNGPSRPIPLDERAAKTER